MPRVSLTDLVDIVSKSGMPKATKVGQVKQRPDYEPAFDFYKPLRERIVEVHKGNGQKAALLSFLAGVRNDVKKKNYAPAIAGYNRWWARKTLTWFTPPRGIYTQAGVDVIVNPELGLVIDGMPHIVKLYFKEDVVRKTSTNLITTVMETVLRAKCSNQATMAVLDVRKGRLMPLPAAGEPFMALVDAELAYIGTLWPRL